MGQNRPALRVGGGVAAGGGGGRWGMTYPAPDSTPKPTHDKRT